MKAEAVAGSGGSAVEPETGVTTGGFQGGAPGGAPLTARCGESIGGGDVSVTAVQGSAGAGGSGQPRGERDRRCGLVDVRCRERI